MVCNGAVPASGPDGNVPIEEFVEVITTMKGAAWITADRHPAMNKPRIQASAMKTSIFRRAPVRASLLF
jgi:hypothetical protein